MNTYKCPNCRLEVSGPPNVYGMLKCVWCHTAWEASTEDAPDPNRVHCDQCQMLSINGVACHEIGCPDMKSRWDVEAQAWIKQRTCFECGCTVDVDDMCCNAPEEHFASDAIEELED